MFAARDTGAESLLDLDADMLQDCLCALAGSPPEQAMALAAVALTCTSLHEAAEAAAARMLLTHADAVKRAVLDLEVRYAHGLPLLRSKAESMSLSGPLPDAFRAMLTRPAQKSAMSTLWCDVPQLPLRWTLLSGSWTRLEASDTGWIEMLDGEFDTVGEHARPTDCFAAVRVRLRTPPFIVLASPAGANERVRFVCTSNRRYCTADCATPTFGRTTGLPRRRLRARSADGCARLRLVRAGVPPRHR